MKTTKDYMSAANASVPRIPGADAIALHGSDAIFIDVRDSSAVAKTGTIAGAVWIPRGMLEFAADPEGPYHNAALKPENKLYLVCGAGGQAALAGKTLQEMGFTNVTNIGGIGEWKDAGGPMQEG